MTMSIDTIPSDIDEAAATRGAVYALFARATDHPDEELHAAFVDGTFRREVATLLDRSGLDVEPPAFETVDDYETVCARYNDLFVLGYSEYENPMDGTLNSTDPPVPLHESAYRTDVSWNDVNLDLARAYDYYDLSIDESAREHHDHARLQVEFAGYLARREAAIDGVDAAAARLDFLDRHLSILTQGVVERLHEETKTGLYRPLFETLAAVVQADRDDLGAREVDDQ